MRLAAFVAPYLLEATVRFVEAAARLPGVALALITHEPADRLPPGLRESLAAHWRVDDALDPEQLVAAARGLQAQAGQPVERLIAVLEQAQVPVAQARHALGLHGMDVEAAVNFRDKNRMKDVLRAAGIPVARHRLCTTPEDGFAFAAEAGYPLVVKPPSGAGAIGTFRLDDDDALRRWLEASPPSAANPALVEEFLVGEEFSFDSVTIDGEVVWHSIASYQPTPLEVLRNPWMQWTVLLPRDISGPEFDPIRKIGPAALAALGLRTGLSHMEWFRRSADGSIAVSEVGARPPGAGISSAIGHAHDVDLYQVWPRLLLLDQFEPPPRSWAVGIAYPRGQGAGRVKDVHGLDALQRDLGHLVVEVELPQIGQAPSGAYSGEGIVIVRHQDTAVVAEALRQIVSRLRIELA